MIIEHCTVQIIGAKIDIPSKQATKIQQNHNDYKILKNFRCFKSFIL